jgi:hypothetical protein
MAGSCARNERIELRVQFTVCYHTAAPEVGFERRGRPIARHPAPRPPQPPSGRRRARGRRRVRGCSPHRPPLRAGRGSTRRVDHAWPLTMGCALSLCPRRRRRRAAGGAYAVPTAATAVGAAGAGARQGGGLGWAARPPTPARGPANSAAVARCTQPAPLSRLPVTRPRLPPPRRGAGPTLGTLSLWGCRRRPASRPLGECGRAEACQEAGGPAAAGIPGWPQHRRAPIPVPSLRRRSIGGQQFAVESCTGCRLYLLDACAMVTVDDCSGCSVFIGPTDSR